jgi:release factor glutamine methyltransferase
MIDSGTQLGALRWAVQELSAHEISESRLNAEVLLGHVRGVPRSALYLEGDRRLSPQDRDRYRNLVRERCRHRPLAYLVGRVEFLESELLVDERVLIPRPETEILVEEAAKRISHRVRDSERLAILDVGTGSGAIALALVHLLPDAFAVATDISRDALKVAQANARALGAINRVSFLCGDLFGPLKGRTTGLRFDLVISNPPYVSDDEIEDLAPEIRDHEPADAYQAGPDPLSFHRRILGEAPAFLREGGLLGLELGAGQADRALKLVTENGAYEDAEVVTDYSGIGRCLFARKRICGPREREVPAV